MTLICRLALCLLPFHSAAATQPAPPTETQLPPVLFSQAWCPTRPQLAALEEHLTLEMNGCCVFRGYARSAIGVPAGALTAFLPHLAARIDLGGCTGTTDEIEAAKHAAAAALQAETALRLRQQGPIKAKALEQLDLCMHFGAALRGEELPPDLQFETAKTILRAELRRRRLLINEPAAVASRFTIGASECQLYASYGAPTKRNRTVGRHGEHVQHVYGPRLYVYTENGRVTGWQD